jgi:hypothetical protein
LKKIKLFLNPFFHLHHKVEKQHRGFQKRKKACHSRLPAEMKCKQECFNRESYPKSKIKILAFACPPTLGELKRTCSPSSAEPDRPIPLRVNKTEWKAD